MSLIQGSYRVLKVDVSKSEIFCNFEKMFTKNCVFSVQLPLDIS